MNELLMIVGVFVFFISVYGAVMVGGHLLEELAQADEPPAPRPATGDHDNAVAAAPEQHGPTDATRV